MYRTLAIIQMVLLVGCGNTITVNPVIPGLPVNSLTKDLVPKDSTPYAFVSRTSCWINKVRTNGPSYRSSGNTAYSCTGGGGNCGSYPPGTATNQMNFYRDGTVSFNDESGVVGVYVVELYGPDCEIYFRNLNDSKYIYDLTPVNYPGVPATILDSRDYLRYIEVQKFLNPGADNTKDSGSIWTCQMVY